MAPPGHAAAPALDLVAAFARAASEVAETVPSCDMAAGVPACPGWTSYDLVVHLGNVHAWAATVVETRRRAPLLDDHPPSRRPRAVAEWYAGKAEDLLAVLKEARPDQECWTFAAGRQDQGFWLRRQAHETLVHLVDLHQTIGRTTDVPADQAADGVAEVLEVFLPRMHARGRPADLAAPLLLHATDTGDTWLLTPTDGPPQVRHVTDTDLVDDGTDLVRAPAATLMLLLWRRVSPEDADVDLDGDRERLLRFLRSPLTS